MGFHSSLSLSETEVNFYPVSPKLIDLACRKCPAGFSTLCSQTEESRCVKCAEGTYSEHASRRVTCKRCSSCGFKEFEVLPCTPTSNVVCKECSACPPGFGVLRPCEKTRDTVCKECPFDKDGIRIYKDKDCGRGGGEDFLVRNKSREHEKPEDRLTVVRVENPFADGRRNPKFQHRLVLGVHSTSPKPPSLFSSRIPTVNSSPSSQQAEKTIYDYDLTLQHPTDHRMQGDDENTPHRPSRKTGQNSTDTVTPRWKSSLSSSQPLNTKLNTFGIEEERTTKVPQPEHTIRTKGAFKSGTVNMMSLDLDKEVMLPEPNSGRDQDIFPQTKPWLWIPITVVIVAVFVVALALHRLKNFKKTKGCFFVCPLSDCRRPRCMAPSDCCDSTSVSSVAGSWAEQGGNVVGVPVDVHEPESSQPTLHTFLPSENTVVAADVHHTTVFDVFNITSPLRYITKAEATFDNTGGKLSAPDSDVTITVDSGAVPDGVHQNFFFRVVYDETSLLRDIPETPDRTLISPVIECGPHDINLLKPVEITVPHCLYFDEIKKDSIAVYRCERYSDQGTIQWEKVPSISEKNHHSKAWFVVKKDSVHIKTKTFSFWSIFSCGGSKKKRATVFFSRPGRHSDLIYLRFYIYSDNEDSKKRVEIREKERFPGSKPAKEKLFTIYDGGNDIAVKLTEIQEGWELDKTDATQTYPFDIAYRNGFRSNDSCDFAVNPIRENVQPFSCNLRFQQEETSREHTIYLNPGYDLRKATRPSSEEISPSSSTSTISEFHPSNEAEENKGGSKITYAGRSDVPLGKGDEPVTENHLRCIHLKIVKWKDVLRYLGLEDVKIEILDEEHKAISEKCYQGLLTWMRGDKNASTRDLCDALRRADCLEALKELSKEGLPKEEPLAKSMEENNGNNWTIV